MGTLENCDICVKNNNDLGELSTGNLNNNYFIYPQNLYAKKVFQRKLQYFGEKIYPDRNISKYINNINPLVNKINLPPNITNTHPLNGFYESMIRFSNGDIYHGNWNQHGLKDGYGIYIKQDGKVYKGLWKDDKIGNYGIFFDEAGNYYQGGPGGSGEVEIFINNNLLYKGNIVNNLPNGQGTLKSFLDDSIYEGEFVNGKKNGTGKIQFVNGTIYQGTFQNDKYEGNGKLTLPNGCIYEGEFHDNYFNGKGKFIYSNGKIYEGDFRNGNKCGFGKLSWNDNKYYEGYWVNNKPHGEGTYYLNGKVLKGVFRYGKIIIQN